MYYLIIGKENQEPVENAFTYYFEGNFTTDELKNKVKESYYSEYEIDMHGTRVTKEPGLPPREEGTYNFNFWYIFKSEEPITEI